MRSRCSNRRSVAGRSAAQGPGSSARPVRRSYRVTEGRYVSRSSGLARDRSMVLLARFFMGAACLLAVSAFAADGDLDVAFGSGGKVITAVSGSGEVVSSLVQQSDGKLVAAGYSFLNDRPDRPSLQIARYNADGSLDETFGSSGKVTTYVSWYMVATALVQEADGKLVAAGTSMWLGPGDFTLVRYNPDGSLDTSFGGSGIAVPDINPNMADGASALLQQADGKLVAGGQGWNGTSSTFALARVNQDGSLDGSFGAGGTMRLRSAPHRVELWP